MLVGFAVILLLLLINALFVAAEFAAVSSRRARLAQRVEEGNTLAAMVLPIVDDPRKLDAYAATCQLGITASSLVVGFYAQAQLVDVVSPWLARLGGLAPAAAASLSATVILLVLTVSQVIIGELVPKNIAVMYPERMAMATILPVRWTMVLFRPLTLLFKGSSELVLKLLGVEPASEAAHVHSPEEIALLVRESGAGGLLFREERRLIEGTLDLGRSTVRQLMVPRNRMLAASAGQPCDQLFAVLASSPFSRLPLYEGSIDNIVGIVHLKDLLCLHCDPGHFNLQEVMSPPLFVPESMPADTAFSMLQRRRYQVAIVLDEYGGTAGLVTLEDLIEEIFGELQDEFDREAAPYQILPEGRVLMRWDWLVTEVNDLLGLHLPTEYADTVGGLVLSQLGQAPHLGDEVSLGDTVLRIEQVEGNAVSLVSLALSAEQADRLREEAP